MAPPRSSQTSAAIQPGPFFPTRIDIPEDVRTTLVPILNGRLADTFDLYSQTKQAHWNVKGKDFYQLHKLFDELAETVEGHVDLLAERITALGGSAMGTVRMAAAASTLEDLSPDLVDGMSFVNALVERYAHHAHELRTAVDEAETQGDKATAELLTGIVRDVDKALYFLESHLQAGTPGRRAA
ncbi:MAG TPA: DNA starvation/stationary phase protection protein Dps [Candidatus Thermoplasmatota archaeon]|nr:DNA starvation/stationary phase protection protein Dps [Candidatus Thermoplasmatota archaeon]